MNRIMIMLARLALMLLGFAASCFAASVFLHVVWLSSLLGDGLGEWSGASLLSVPLVALAAGYLGFFPTLIALAISESLGKRGWLFYAIAGAIIAAPVAGVVALAITETGDAPRFVLSMLGAGMTGGLAYWLVAGRSAGLWRERVLAES